MSRCFPYPQHGCFSSKIAANEALIDSMKIQREAKKAAKTNSKWKKSAFRRSDTKPSGQLGKRKVRDDEKSHNLGLSLGCDSDENRERSDVTEELGKPSNHPCTSDSSENSCRRKRHATLETGIQTNGSVLKIRLAPQKSKDSVELLDQLTSLNTIPVGRTEVIGHESSSFDKKMKLVSLLYKDIVTDFAPPRHGSSLSKEQPDNSWLFQRRDAQRSERCKPKSDMLSCHSNSTMWNKAGYLPEVELYALPFVVPF